MRYAATRLLMITMLALPMPLAAIAQAQTAAPAPGTLDLTAPDLKLWDRKPATATQPPAAPCSPEDRTHGFNWRTGQPRTGCRGDTSDVERSDSVLKSYRDNGYLGSSGPATIGPQR